MIWIYDIELYQNFFCVTFLNAKTEEIKVFTLYKDTNDIDKLYKFIVDKNKWLVGYNSFTFDNQILNYIYNIYGTLAFADMEDITQTLYQFAHILIESDYRDMAYNLPFKWLDLMKLGGFMKSLKLIGVSLKWHKLQDLPYKWNIRLDKEQAKLVIKYNLNDVLITYELYKSLLPEIRMRYEISKKYKVKAYSESRSGLANRLLEKFYHETSGIPVNEFKKLRTHRKYISFRNVIFSYIHFKTPELDTLYEDLMEYSYYDGQPFFNKVLYFKGKKYKSGFGGLHSVDKAAYFKASDDSELIDVDVGSMYPSIIINNRIKPEHLDSVFLLKYKEIRDLRLREKKAKNKVVADALKVTLNSTFGKMLNRNHWMYDPLAALQITVNGQLMMLMLIEELELEGIEVISANTDGIVSKVTKDKKQKYLDITQSWARKLNFTVDYTYYKKYIRKDVNNYITVKTDGDVKAKGVFQIDIDLMKGYDKPIESIALYNYFIKNIPIEETILNHNDIYDFCVAKKIGDDFENIIEYVQDGKIVQKSLQKSVRYYVSKSGVILSKIKKVNNNRIQYESRQTISLFNDYKKMDNFNQYDIDYTYYIVNARKIINEIMQVNKQLSLFEK